MGNFAGLFILFFMCSMASISIGKFMAANDAEIYNEKIKLYSDELSCVIDKKQGCEKYLFVSYK